MTKTVRGTASLAVTAGALAMAGALSAGCSVIFHVDGNQCAVDGDCRARGAAFEGYTCSKGNCVVPVATNDGGADAGAPPCKTNADCKPDPSGHDVACDVGTGNCLTVTSDECPILLGDITSTALPPIFIGAFIVVPPSGPLTHPSTLNFTMALNEFATIGPGIPAGPGTGRRTPVAVACNVAADPTKSMNHLINDVHVPVIVSALSTATLATVFSQFDNATPSANVLFINAFDANSNLAVGTNGLLWSMLGAPGNVAPVYDAFLPFLEKYMRQSPPWNFGSAASRPLKVAFVTSQATDLVDLAKAVKDTVTWNGGQGVAANHANGNEFDYILNNSYLNASSSSPTFMADVATEAASVAQTIADNAPDVIVSFAGEEFTQLAQNIEYDWTAPTLPFYLLGPYNYQSTQFAAQTKQFAGTPDYDSMQHRLAGIGIANTNDPTALQVYSDYQTRYLSVNKPNTDTGESNYYDAMYFALYSYIGAGRMKVLGSDLALAMRRQLIAPPPATQYPMGPDSIGAVTKALSDGDQIGLTGTLGPPDFSVGTGSRVSEGDVYCIMPPNDAGVSAYASDVLRLTNPDGGAAPDASPFTGTFPCYPGLQ